MERPKTIFCDIDGTLWNHVGGVPEQATVNGHKLLPNTKEAIDKWDRLGYSNINLNLPNDCHFIELKNGEKQRKNY